MTRNTDLFAVACIVVFSLAASAVASVASYPVLRGDFLETRIQERLEPQLMRIQERIEHGIERTVEQALCKMRY